MTVDPRTEIMARIRAALRSSGLVEPAPEIVVDSGRPVVADSAIAEDLSARFARELALVGGDAAIVAELGIGALSQGVADHAARCGYRAVVVQRDAFALQAASRIPAALLIDVSGASIDRLEKADCAIIAAESLIADTGSAVVRLSAYEERLLPYLPPACIIVARTTSLVASLDESALLAGDTERGERVIITGPSRTADIEKTIVLGAHGPRSLTVIIGAA